MTRQPAARSSRFTARSRALLRVNLGTQNESRDFGIRACFGHPCQKHPSTKMTTLSRLKTKSGLPTPFIPRRHPVIPDARSNAARRSSVLLFARLRTFDIRALRSAIDKVSATSGSILNGFACRDRLEVRGDLAQNLRLARRFRDFCHRDRWPHWPRGPGELAGGAASLRAEPPETIAPEYARSVVVRSASESRNCEENKQP